MSGPYILFILPPLNRKQHRCRNSYTTRITSTIQGS